jgi:hypothetical protein
VLRGRRWTVDRAVEAAGKRPSEASQGHQRVVWCVLVGDGAGDGSRRLDGEDLSFSVKQRARARVLERWGNEMIGPRGAADDPDWFRCSELVSKVPIFSF